MVLMLMSKLFGVLPVGRDNKRSGPMFAYSVALIGGLAIVSYIWAGNIELRIDRSESNNFWFRRCLELSNIALRISMWLSQLWSVYTHDTEFLTVLDEGKNIETGLSMLICLGLPTSDLLFFSLRTGRSTGRLPTLISGLTRLNQLLITNQFIKIVVRFTGDLRKRLEFSFSLLESMRIQRDILKKAKQLNDFYQLQILLSVGSIFVTLSSEAYYIMNKLVSVDEWDTFLEDVGSIGYIVKELCWLSFSLYWFLRLAQSCEKFYDQVEHLNDMIYHEAKLSEELKSNEKIQLHIIKKPNLVFTAYRFFPIGYPLVSSVIAAAATYLVILVELTV